MKQSDYDGPVGGVAVQARLRMVGLYPRDDEQGLSRRMLFQGRNKDVNLLYVTDHISGCSYVDVSGDDAESLIPVIERRLDVWTDEELVESWKTADGEAEKSQAVLRLGVASMGEFAEQWDTHIREGLKASLEPVRFAAVKAIGYCEWESLDEELSSLAESDESERVRDRASLTLELRREDRRKRAAASEPS